jgi:hypothetical protein
MTSLLSEKITDKSVGWRLVRAREGPEILSEETTRSLAQSTS